MFLKTIRSNFLENNTYSRIKDHIFSNLKKQSEVLTETSIKEEIANTRSLIQKIGRDVFAQVLPKKNELSELLDEEWGRMERELEAEFNVKMERGVIIHGEQQRSRDLLWWSDKEKIHNDCFFWKRYKKYISSSFSSGVVKTLDEDTDVIMNNIENPLVNKFSIKGMVVGHVQAGKTGNYAGLICKAADAGYKFILVIAGGTNNLRKQTQQRLNESFVGYEIDKQVGVGVGMPSHERPVSLTTPDKDFNVHDARSNSGAISFDVVSMPILIVIKKNTRSLSNVISWLNSIYKNGVQDHPMLLIDDESDYASINTKEEDDPTKINQKIRELLNLFSKNSYIAYTATPYANIFIDHQTIHDDLGADLFPKDFICALDAPTNYFGAERVFSRDRNILVEEIDDYQDVFPPKHKKELDVVDLPESLYEAILLFLLNISIRHLRGQATLHNSMLIHATRFTMVHQKIAIVVNDYVEKVSKVVEAYGKLENCEEQDEFLQDLKDVFDKYHGDKGYLWVRVVSKLADVIGSVIIREVHQKTKIPIEYKRDVPTNVIAIGGTSLSRGFTLEGLSVSYFLRNTIFYDTLMQMGRWFGYRVGYDDLCRIFMPECIADSFSVIIDATNELFEDFKRMSADNMTPEQFGLCVRRHPDSLLQVTSRNKQKNTQDIYHEMCLDGYLKETARLPRDLNDRAGNLKLLCEFVGRLSNKKYNYSDIDGSHLWKNVKKELIFDFVANFKCFQNDPYGISSRMPTEFIKRYITDVNTEWDVALFSGRRSNEIKQVTDAISIYKEARQLVDKEESYEVKNRAVSSESSESLSLSSEDRVKYKSDRVGARSVMERPLLMLHIMQTDVDNECAAFGISFPSNKIISGKRNVILKVNTVYMKNLQELLEEEESDD